MTPAEIRYFQTTGGSRPAIDWLEGLADRSVRARILARIDRLALGNAGDFASVGEGVLELRLDFGPGYRVYYSKVGSVVLLLLCGGDKSTQKKDIANAKAYLKDYRARSA
jgi:putative addiction module killer protein